MAGEVPYALRLPKDLKSDLERLAKREHRSLNGEIVAICEEAIEQARKSGRLP